MDGNALDRRTRELIGIGASIAGNCLPCLSYHFAEALKVGSTVEEIAEAIKLSKMVKESPMNEIYRLAEQLLRRSGKEQTNE